MNGEYERGEGERQTPSTGCQTKSCKMNVKVSVSRTRRGLETSGFTHRLEARDEWTQGGMRRTTD